MRISDWSSDVCSSDLDRTFRIPEPDQKVYDRQQDRDHVPDHMLPGMRQTPDLADAEAVDNSSYRRECGRDDRRTQQVNGGRSIERVRSLPVDKVAHKVSNEESARKRDTQRRDRLVSAS